MMKRDMPLIRQIMVVMLSASAAACAGDGPTTPSNGYAGQWAGTVLVMPAVIPGAGLATLQSRPISFVVSADQRVTELSIGYDFSGCSGTKTFSGLSVTIGPLPRSLEQGWGFGTSATDGTNRTEVYATFTSNREASGTSLFIDFPGCGSGGGNWTATKQ